VAALAAFQSGLADNLTTEQVLDLIFRDPSVKHGLLEFADLGKKPHEILRIFPKIVNRGKNEVRYYLKCLKRNEDIQVFSEKKANPEEVVRQLWLYKLHHSYRYSFDHITVEHQVVFGTVTAEKAADIVVFQKDGKTAKIIVSKSSGQIEKTASISSRAISMLKARRLAYGLMARNA